MDSPAMHVPRSTVRPAAANDNRRHTPLSKPAFPADAVAYVHRPCRSAMTSAPGEAEWRLEFEPRNAPFLDPLMGWTGGRDPLRHVSLGFPTLEAALAYAERQGLRTIVHHDAQSRADQRDVAKRAFSDDTLRQLGLGRLQKSYGEAMAQASRGEEKAQRESGDSPMDVVLRPDLSVDEKRSILMNWAFDLHLILQRQSDAAAASRLSEIEEAVLVLEDQAGRRPSVPAPRAAA